MKKRFGFVTTEGGDKLLVLFGKPFVIKRAPHSLGIMQLKEHALKTETEKLRKARNKMLRSLDIAGARDYLVDSGSSPDMVRMMSTEAILMGLHQARVECEDIHERQRLRSIEWLRERGLKRRGGVALPEKGVLPE